MFSINFYNIIALASVSLGLYSYFSFINEDSIFYKYVCILFLTNISFLNFSKNNGYDLAFQLSITFYLVFLIIFSYKDHQFLPKKQLLLIRLGFGEIIYLLCISFISTEFIYILCCANFILCTILSYILKLNHRTNSNYKLKKLYQNEYETTLLLNMCLFLSCFSFLYTLFTIYFAIISLYCILLINLYYHVNKNLLSYERKKYENLKKHFQRSVHLEYHRQADILKGTIEEVKKSSMKDPLTRILNKKGIETIYNEWLDQKDIDTFSIAMFDIDKFKSINDTLGHVQGDQCLVNIVRIINERFPTINVLGRFGGDEFIVMMPHLSINEMVDIAEEIRHAIQMHSNPKCTISMGLAQYPEDGHLLVELIEHADKGLYLSKQKGRNSVSYYSQKFEKILNL